MAIPKPLSGSTPWDTSLNASLDAASADAQAVAAAAYVPKATLTNKGDSYVATSAGVVSRLPVGTNGSVQMADSTLTLGRKWKLLDTSDIADIEVSSPVDGQGLLWSTGQGAFVNGFQQAAAYHDIATVTLNPGDVVPSDFPDKGWVGVRQTGSTPTLGAAYLGGNAVNGATCTVAASAALSIGDYVVMAVEISAETSVPTFSASGPSGISFGAPVATINQGSTNAVAIFVGKVTSAIGTGGSFTSTLSAGRNNHIMQIAKVTGVVGTGAVETVQNTNTAGTSLAPTVSTNGATTNAKDILFAVFGWNPSTTTAAATWGSATQLGTSIQSATGPRTIAFLFQIVATTGTKSFTGTFTAPAGIGYAAAIVALKGV
jgi:hypothetical protein